MAKRSNPVNDKESVDNIWAMYNTATDKEKRDGNQWYALALEQAQSLATDTKLDLKVVIGVISAVSPRNNWTKNMVDASNMCRAFVSGWNPFDVTVSTFDSFKQTAVDILESGDPSLLSGVKRLAFARTISDPDGSEVCIDGHAYNVYVGYRAVSDKSVRVTSARFARAAGAYAEVADELGLLPNQVQATTWLAWKRVHNI